MSASDMLDGALPDQPRSSWVLCCDATEWGKHLPSCENYRAAQARDEATRCHDVWPLLDAWARAEREQEAANEAFHGDRMRAARKAHDEAVANLLAAVPNEEK